MTLEISGKLIEVYKIQEVSATFKKREFVIEYMDNGYANFVKFQLVQDKCSIIDGFTLGSEIKVSFNLKGNKYNAKDGSIGYITNLQAWRITGGSASGAAPVSNTEASSPSTNLSEAFPTQEGSSEDLPF